MPLDKALAHPPLAVAHELPAERCGPGWSMLECPQDLVTLAEREGEELRLGVVGALEPLRGVDRADLSRILGTSVTQIDATYGHLVPDSEEYLRGLLDVFDARPQEHAASE